MGFLERSEALGAQVLLRLHLDGVDVVRLLHQKVDLARGVLCRPVVRHKPAIGYELLADVRLGEGALELLEDLIAADNRLLVEPRHRAQQADIQQEELERRVVGVGRQRDAGLGDPADERRGPRLREPRDARLVVPRPSALRDVAEDELLVLVTQMSRDRPPCCQRVLGLGPAEMLGDVTLVAAQDLELNLPRVLKETSLEKGAHRLWHPTYVIVLTKKRSGRSHRVSGRVLAEVLEGGERLRARLDLVEDDEGSVLGHNLARLESDGRDDARDVVAQLELLAHPGVVVEVHVRDVLELRPAELLEQPVLPTWRAPLRMSGLRRGLSFQATRSSMRNRSMQAPPQKWLRPYLRTKWQK